MEDNKSKATVELLRETLLQDIHLQEQVRNLFRKIIKRLSIIFIAMSISVLIGIIIIIYIVVQPGSATGVAMKQVEELNKDLMTESKFIQFEREDVATARKQLDGMLKVQDSIKRQQDSAEEFIFNYNLKKALK